MSWLVKQGRYIVGKFPTREEAVSYMVEISEEFYNRNLLDGNITRPSRDYSQKDVTCIVVKRYDVMHTWSVERRAQ